MKPKVFISVGSAYTNEQQKFVDALIDWLRDEGGVEPMMLGRTVYPAKQPLKVIQETMQGCDGTLVVAFERIFVADGEEKRGGGTAASQLHRQIIPTVWNQIETAMAYGLEQPILVLSENGSRREGLLEDKFEWLVYSISVDESMMHDTALQKTLRQWISGLVEERAKRKQRLVRQLDPATLTMSDLYKVMRPSQLWKCVTIFGVVVAAAFAFGKMVGTMTSANIKVGAQPVSMTIQAPTPGSAASAAK